MSLLTLAAGVLWAPPVLFIGALPFIVYQGVFLENFGKFEHMPGYLKRLLRHGYHKAFVQFTHKPTRRSIKFEKYLGLGGYGIALVVPKDWPKDEIARLRNWCDANGLTLRPHRDNEATGPTDLQIDCGKDLRLAHALTREIWINVFGLTNRTNYKFESKDILPLDEIVDSPAYPRLTEEEIQKRQREDAARQLADTKLRSRLMGANFGCLIGIVGLTIFVSMIGLSITTLAALGNSPDWSVTIGAVTASGSTASLVFFALYLLSYSVEAFCRDTDLPILSRAEAAFQIVAQTIVVALPVSVVAVWIGA